MLTIAARQSQLAQLQAYSVGKALQKVHPQLEIKYHFRESLGDKNQSDPLWKMPEKGVFTEDFVAGLHSGEFDLVVHSWKDLPMEERPGLSIIATLPREDARDLLLVKNKFFEHDTNISPRNKIKIFSSSPRRALNIGSLLKKIWPANLGLEQIEFVSVRGNMTTRLKKLIESDEVDGLVVAKAAFDRMMKSGREWQKMHDEIKPLIKMCRWMVLPLSENPTAAAQGALAIEALESRTDLKKLLSSINCDETFNHVLWERDILKSYGGGCHQAIGVSAIGEDETIVFIKGLTQQHEDLNERRYKKNLNIAQHFLSSKMTVDVPKTEDFFVRTNANDIQEPMSKNKTNDLIGLFITRSEALPQSFMQLDQHILWTSGLQTWIKLAQKGYWIHGTSDAMGFAPPDLSAVGILNSIPWIRLTHSLFNTSDQTKNDNNHLDKIHKNNQVIQTVNKTVNDNKPEIESETKTEPETESVLKTYQLIPKPKSQVTLRPADFYFWKSGILFEKALDLYPELLEKKHGCGYGETFKTLKKYLVLNKNLFCFYDVDDFYKNVGLEENK